MSRSLLKLVLVLMLVGVLPFAASLLIVNDLFTQAVSVGLNNEVRDHLVRSAEAYRRFFESERLSHGLAADRVASDPRWNQVAQRVGEDRVDTCRELLNSYRQIHPRLLSLALRGPDGSDGVTVQLGEIQLDHVSRQESRQLSPSSIPFDLILTFDLPAHYAAELEAIGDTLNTFRALESLQEELTGGMRKTYLYFSGGVVLLALLLGALLTRQTTRRIGRIAQAASRVASGDLTVRIEANSRDEIGALARQFNSMVEDLQVTQERVAYLQRLSAWQEIARRLAHEIKNPLTPILLSIQELSRKYDAYSDQPDRFRSVLKDVLEIVEEEVGTLRTLVREFSEFARLPRAEPKPLAVNDFVRDFVRTNPHLSQRVALSVRLDPSGRNPHARIDPTMMRRALVNLVENAIDATLEANRQPPARPDVEISVHSEGKLVLLTVTDNGPGVEESDVAYLFDPYFTTKEHGTGLGLAIVKKIVLDHDGWVSIENRSAREGCRAIIRLNRVAAPDDSATASDEIRDRPG